jgi:hypothetical protein
MEIISSIAILTIWFLTIAIPFSLVGMTNDNQDLDTRDLKRIKDSTKETHFLRG